jgi:PTH1 family peptidyl-tRNA hydrolase
MRSLIHHLGSDRFPRLRVGIGRPPGSMDPADYVLQDFTPAEEAVMAPTRATAVQAIAVWLREGLDAAMNRFNVA